MPNMSYCRFENTLSDLQDCYDALGEMGDYEKELSESEAEAATGMIRLCRRIADDYAA